MSRYRFLLRRYHRSRRQVNCFALFIPVLLLCLLVSAELKTTWTTGYRLLLLCLGWFAASFIEYYIHRFLYHQPAQRQKAFLAEHHHYHHTHPSEIKLGTSVKAGAMVLLVVLLILGFYYTPSFLFMAGLTCGFCAYAFMHKAIHQPWSARVFPRLFQYHIYHHCRYPNKCFGVSTTLWDVVFKTTPPNGATLPKRVVQFYLGRHDHTPVIPDTLSPASAGAAPAPYQLIF